MALNFESKNALIWCIYNLKQLVSTVNPLLSHPRGFLIPNTFEWWGEGGGGGLMETGGLFNLAKTMVSVLHKELEYKVEKPKYKKLEVMQPRMKNKSELPVGE